MSKKAKINPYVEELIKKAEDTGFLYSQAYWQVRGLLALGQFHLRSTHGASLEKARQDLERHEQELRLLVRRLQALHYTFPVTFHDPIPSNDLPPLHFTGAGESSGPSPMSGCTVSQDQKGSSTVDTGSTPEDSRLSEEDVL